MTKKIILIAIISLAFLGVKQAHAARLFTSGFELATTTAGVEWTTLNSNGVITATTTNARSGSYDLYVASTTAALPTTNGITFSNTATSGPIYARFYFRAAILPQQDNEIASFKNLANGTTETFIHLTSAGQLRMVNSTGGASIGITAGSINLNQWYRVEMKFQNGAGATDTLEAKLDGAIFATTSTSTVGANILSFHVGANTAGGPVTSTIMYYDDIAVNDSTGASQNSYPGDGKVIVLNPNAAGDSNQWNNTANGVGDANNYTLVREVTPNDATDMTQATSTGKRDLYNVSASGIQSYDTVNVVQVGARFSESSAAILPTFRVLAEKAGSGTLASSSEIIPNSTTWKTNNVTTTLAYPLTLYNDPDGATWTNTTLDSMQIGQEILNGVSTNKTASSTLITSGSGNWTAPSNIDTTSTIEVWGGGGAGGGSNATGGSGSGGAGGAYSMLNSTSVSPGAVYAYVVGAGGAGSAGAAGGNGATSTFNGSASTGVAAASGGLGGAIDAGTPGKGNTTSSVGNTIYKGGDGGTGVNGAASGGGGEGACTTGIGNSASGATKGSGCDGGDGANGTSTDGTGAAGTAPGGAGAGGKSTGSPNMAGGAGAAGQVKISYFLLADTTTRDQVSTIWAMVDYTAGTAPQGPVVAKRRIMIF